MRDVMLIVPTNKETEWNLDIDVVDGYPVFLFEEGNTADQRASLAAYQSKGSIPGMRDEGIDWSGLYEKDTSLVDIDNQAKQRIQELAGATSFQSNYTPLYKEEDNNIVLNIYKVG